MKLKLGLSTCPNDTFMFHAIINQKIDLQGLDFEIQYLDVQELNLLLADGALDCSKASFHAALHLADRYGVLPAGSALGHGVGPIIVTAAAGAAPMKDSVVCCPGEWTTAALLFRMAFPETTRIEHCVFSEIMPRVQSGRADFGVVIHEGRFTFENYGLALAGDLGQWWETETDRPLPLGGILARLDLPTDVHRRLGSVIRDSVQYGFEHREETLPTMRLHAQELSDDAIWPHVDLYVNQYSLELAEDGAAALRAMANLARDRHVLATLHSQLRILS